MPEKRYQDYVIKDGQLVGKFEDAYKNFDGFSGASRAYGSFTEPSSRVAMSAPSNRALFEQFLSEGTRGAIFDAIDKYVNL